MRYVGGMRVLRAGGENAGQAVEAPFFPSSFRMSDPIMLRPTHCETASVGPHWLLIQLHVVLSPRHSRGGGGGGERRVGEE